MDTEKPRNLTADSQVCVELNQGRESGNQITHLMTQILSMIPRYLLRKKQQDIYLFQLILQGTSGRQLLQDDKSYP